MANITVTQIQNTGSELFQDSESFLNELSNLDSITGGTDDSVSSISTLTKLAEAFVNVYAIEHIAYLAKSFSSGGY